MKNRNMVPTGGEDDLFTCFNCIPSTTTLKCDTRSYQVPTTVLEQDIASMRSDEDADVAPVLCFS